ncbi:hypothetical protein CBOM_03295 [Ceraceosorus bombacis]|uniref:Uncharacterized protein n=1 Tax=Ceraceosorus bombacis TaxID=401625 RepID=A0A0P1BL38_9BASI|nr:hypothetical protein CBOM_03295 [Ceraceosorus bombacis]
MELKLDTSESHIYVWPGSTVNEEGQSAQAPRDDAVLVAFITLSIPAKSSPPSRIHCLSVTLEAVENIGFPSGSYETNRPFKVRCASEQAIDMPIEAGKSYRWELPLSIPHDVVPYERCNLGRVYFRLSTKLHFGGNFITRRTLSASKDMFIIAVPSEDNVLDYAQSHGTFVEHLGPVALAVRSQHMTVGGYARLALSLPSPSPTLVLDQFSLSVVQNTTLHSRQSERIERARPESRVITAIEFDELLSKRLPDGTYEGNWIARMPHDSQIRSSTLAASKAAIRLSHSLEVRIIYRPDDLPSTKPLLYRASWSLILPHCACMWRSMRLPSYSIADPCPVPERGRDDWMPERYANIHVSHSGCACGETLETLLAWEDEVDDEQDVCTTRMMWEDMRRQWERRGPGSAAAARAEHLRQQHYRRMANEHAEIAQGGPAAIDTLTPDSGSGGQPAASSLPTSPDGAPNADGLPPMPPAFEFPPSPEENETEEERERRFQSAKSAQQYVSVTPYPS